MRTDPLEKQLREYAGRVLDGSGIMCEVPYELLEKAADVIEGRPVAKQANPSGITPTEFKILIEPKPVEEKTKGGIILPDETKERDQFAQQEGTIVAVSTLAFGYASAQEWNGGKPKVGDRVSYARYAGAVLKGKDGKSYRVVNDKDVYAVLN